MNWSQILNILEGALLILAYLVWQYYKSSSTFRGFIAELIADAEVEFSNVAKAGELKMAWVISKLYSYIPIVFKPFFSEDKLREIVQMVFAQISAYADIQIAKLKAQYEAKKKK